MAITWSHLYWFELWILRTEAAGASTTLFLYLKAVYQSCAVPKGSREETLEIAGARGEATSRAEKALESGFLSSPSISLLLMLKEWDTSVLFSPDSLLSA